MSTSKTGKHGHAKCHFVALDIFTGKKLEDLQPSSHNSEARLLHHASSLPSRLVHVPQSHDRTWLTTVFLLSLTGSQSGRNQSTSHRT